MRRKQNHSGAVGSKAIDDPRQGWLIPKEELLRQGVIVSRYGDFDRNFTPLSPIGKDVDG